MAISAQRARRLHERGAEAELFLPSRNIVQIQAFWVNPGITVIVSWSYAMLIGEEKKKSVGTCCNVGLHSRPQTCPEILLMHSDLCVPTVPDAIAFCLYFCCMQAIYFA